VQWDELVGPGRAHTLRDALMRALQAAYDENGKRFAPDDLGDNNVTFGVSVSQNLRFLIEREVEGIAGIEVVRPRGSFALRIDERVELYFYKAPPGVCDVRSLRFDASKMQLEILEANSNQLALDFGDEPAQPGELRHVVCVHFGDPFEGLHRADVGAPTESALEGIRWEWLECLSDDGDEASATPLDNAPREDDDDDDFDLRLRDWPTEEDRGVSGDSTG
jgi:hypothetical protein